MHRHLAVIAMASLLVVACNGENRPIPDMGPPRALPPNNGSEPLKGALGNPIGTISAGEFAAAVKNIESWNGGSEADRCTDAFLCGIGFSKVPVSIQPAIDAANANFKNVGANGSILIRLMNRGKKATGGLGRYELEPGKTYYVVVSSTGPRTARWDLVPFDDGQTTIPEHWGKGGSFHSCEHPPAKSSKAAFLSCKAAEQYANDTLSGVKKTAIGDFGIIGALVQAAGFAPGFLTQSPGWVSCAFGCCTLE